MNPDSIDPFENLRERTVSAIRRAREIDRPVLVSVSMAIAVPEDLIGLFERAGTDAMDRVFWESRGTSMVGVGTAWSSSAGGADRFRTLSAASEALLQDAMIPGSPPAEPRIFGAFAFASDVDPEGPWHGFPAARLVLPRLLVARENGRTTLTASVVVGAESDPDRLGLVEDLSWLRDSSAAPASEVDRIEGRRCEATSIPGEDEWRRSVSSVLAEIERGNIEKLVLARATGLRADHDFDCAAILRHLGLAYPACIRFCIANREGTFLGATPEPLVRRAGSTVSTAAIAGSAARALSCEEDRSLRAGLLASAKEAHEHEVVVRSIRSALEPLCEELRVAAAPHVLELANVRHLATEIRGRLRDALPLLELVERLHPTPAVAGFPRLAALAEIRRREALDRGWYAGPIGWMDAAGNGEFAVAIRSALVKGREALLYAGAGIVAGSDPDRELAETRLKLAPLLAAMTGASSA
jgi:isochorismate synthase